MPDKPKSAIEIATAAGTPVPGRKVAIIPPSASSFLPPGLAEYVAMLGDAQPAIAATHQGAGRVEGPGGPEDDRVDARLSDGEYVLPEEAVSGLGGGDNEAGADRLDKVVRNVTGEEPENSGGEDPLEDREQE